MPLLAYKPSVREDDNKVEPHGLTELLTVARIEDASRKKLIEQIATLGAVSVREVTRNDWMDLPYWPLLKEMERRRILNLVQ